MRNPKRHDIKKNIGPSFTFSPQAAIYVCICIGNPHKLPVIMFFPNTQNSAASITLVEGKVRRRISLSDILFIQSEHIYMRIFQSESWAFENCRSARWPENIAPWSASWFDSATTESVFPPNSSQLYYQPAMGEYVQQWNCAGSWTRNSR